METVAALANDLKSLEDTAEKGRPSYDTIKPRLGIYQKARNVRSTSICKAASDPTRLQALATPKDKFLAI